jgi:molybdopterin molybdotransferase
MLELEEAVARILTVMPPVQSERIPLMSAHRRVLTGTVHSRIDLPPFDNSAMDGYAVRANDAGAASAATPVRLRLVGKVAAGETFSTQVDAGCCVRVFTGSMLPAGADCVVMQEDTRIDDPAKPSEITLLEPGRAWENIRLRGEDIRVGAPLATEGQTLSAGILSLLSAAGETQVDVGRRPVVGLVTTGSELQEPGQPLSAGRVYDSNRIGLATLIQSVGGQPVIFPIVVDTLSTTVDALSQAFTQCDLVITIGGASVGDLDFIKPALSRMGAQLDFWRVAIRPGRPFLFGRLQGKFLFGLPGNPVSALVTFLLLVRPALLCWQGSKNSELPSYAGKLSEPLTNPGLRRWFVNVRIGPGGAVSSAGAQGSHILGSFAAAQGLVEVAPKSTLPEGSTVAVRVWEL